MGEPARWRRGLFGSVRARAAVGATLVVALALVGTGLGVLLMLRANLLGQAGLEAEVTAREVGARIATGTAPERLDLDAEAPVRVVDRAGRIRAASAGLESVSGLSGMGTKRVNGLDARDATFTSEGALRLDARDTPDARPATDSDRFGEPQPLPDRREEDRREEVREREELRGQERPDDGDEDDDRDDEDDDQDDEVEVPQAGEVAAAVFRTVDGAAVVDGDRAEYRFVALRVTHPGGETFSVYAGAPLAAEREATATVRGAMLVGLPLLLAVVASVTWLTTRRALRPVEGIRGEMAEITRSQDLSRRVPQPPSRDEIGRLARTTNETLAALESSVEQQRRFVADASHELRSPLASLRTQLEVGVAHPELLDLPGAVADTVRLQELAADLLLLARLDAGQQPSFAPVELAELVSEEVSQRVRDRLPIQVEAPDPVEVSGSRRQLSRLLGNLLDNAQRHAGTAVRVTARRVAGEAVLEVADDGDGVPEAERERIFERFVRLDDARSRDEGGAGLGLALAREIAVRHGGDLSVGTAPEGGARFVLSLPLRASGPAGPLAGR